MTSITIDKDIKLSKTHFSSIEELQEALLLIQHEQFELSKKQIAFLKERELEADRAIEQGDRGMSWDISRITRKHV